MKNRTISVGSRNSPLAIAQARIVIDIVKKTNPSLNFEIAAIKTTGDKILDEPLDLVGGKGLFIKELEQALLSGNIDIAVHSFKDIPIEENDNLPIVALSKRESPFDVLVLPKDSSNLDNSKPVGSSSARRTIQFAKMYKGFEVKAIRGNIASRLQKLDKGEYSALILAQAGLNRLGLQNRISRIFTIGEMLPSAGQGILAVQGRKGEDYSFLNAFHNYESEIASKAERRFLKNLNGGCSSPTAVYGQVRGDELLLTGMCVDACGNMEIGKLCGSKDKSEELGETLALRLKEKAGLK